MATDSYASPMAEEASQRGDGRRRQGGVPVRISRTVRSGMNSHMVLAMVSENSSPRGPNALLSPLRISFTTASRVGSSSFTKSLHVIVIAPGGAGTSDVEVVGVGDDLLVPLGRDVVVDVGVDPPGSVVSATEPPAVL